MKKKFFSFLFLFTCLLGSHITAHAADLLDVYQQALASDPIYQQAVAQALSTRENLPISLASLLPNVAFTGSPSVTRTGVAGINYVSTVGNSSNTLSPRNNTQRAYTWTLSVTQTVFNFAQFAAVAGANATAKNAAATLNAALQSLMTRTSSAYFAVLQDEDNVASTEAAKAAFAEQLDQVKQQYQVGIKTITDVYTAQASYASAVANVIAAQTQLSNDRENLRVITGQYYPNLLSLSEDFPLISPQPTAIETWVTLAQQQNWTVKASQYNVDAALQSIRQQFAGHLPSVNLQGSINKQYIANNNDYNTFNTRDGPGTASSREIDLNITMPIFSGGAVVAQTNQAVYNYQVARQQLEQSIRNTLNTTRQSYLGIVSGISQINADKVAITSSISSVQGMEESYRVGTGTLVDVLNQRQKVLEAQLRYAQDRYGFVNNVLALKRAAGTLSQDDLRAINAWLIERKIVAAKKPSRRATMPYVYDNQKLVQPAQNLTEAAPPAPKKILLPTKRVLITA